MQTRFFEYFRISFFAHNFFIFENFSKISICVPPKPTLLYNFDFIKNFVSLTLKIDTKIFMKAKLSSRVDFTEIEIFKKFQFAFPKLIMIYNFGWMYFLRISTPLGRNLRFSSKIMRNIRISQNNAYHKKVDFQS